MKAVHANPVLHRWSQRLDKIPFDRAAMIGGAVGLGFGLMFMLFGAKGLIGVAALSGAMTWIVWTAQPIFVDAVQPSTEPPRPPMLDLLETVELQGGTFLMGSPESESGRRSNETQHRVSVSPFSIMTTTLTRGHVRELLQRGDILERGSGAENHPMTEVSWWEAIRICNELSAKALRPLCYEIDEEKKTVKWTRDEGGYRLPTEAEWEYAARAGTQTRWSFGDEESRLDEFAWFAGNSKSSIQPVGEKKANPWRLYDMHGNVWEWCWDLFDEYPTEEVTDSRGPDEAPEVFRVLRGGAYWDEPEVLRSAVRVRVRPGRWDVGVGFRCVHRPTPSLVPLSS